MSLVMMIDDSTVHISLSISIISPHRPYYVRRCGLLLLTE